MFERRQNRIQPSSLIGHPKHDRAMARPARSEERLMARQQAFGNQALQRMLQSRIIQAKLTVNQPGDKYEQEADRMADTVMRMPEPHTTQHTISGKQDQIPNIQRMCSECDDELQRQAIDDDEEKLQAKEVAGTTPEVTPQVQSQVNALRSGGQPLPDSARNFFEPRFGHDFSRVRVHTDARAAQSARAVNARAFTLGNDVVFGAGQYSPGTTAGQNLLAHELAHFIQQGHRANSSMLQLKPLTQEEKKKDLKSPRLANNARLQAAFDNTPLMTKGERGAAVTLLQQALIDHGFELPLSTKDTPDGSPDGIFGDETWKAVRDFQIKHKLEHKDGIVGRETLGELDESFSATITLKQIRFITDHNSLKDNRISLGDSGNRFPDPEWTSSNPGGITAPITHSKDLPIMVEAVCDISAPAAQSIPFVLEGRGSQAFLSFTGVGNLVTGTDVVITLTPIQFAPNVIKAFRKQRIDWSANFLGSDTSLGSSRGLDVFLTHGDPSGGVTYKRMAKAIEFARAANTLDEHELVKHILGRAKFDLRNHLSEPWLLAEAIPAGIGADCITIVRFTNGVIRMLGMPGISEEILIWAHPNNPTLALENPPPKPHLEAPIVSPTAAEIKKNPQLKGAQAVLLDCSKPPGPNRFEATLKFTSAGKTVYYAGGVGDKPDAKSVLFDSFRSLSWVRFAGIGQFFIIEHRFIYQKC